MNFAQRGARFSTSIVVTSVGSTNFVTRSWIPPETKQQQRNPVVAQSTSLEPASGMPGSSVLVTGFHDWRDLGTSPNLWRCRDNPSCRLLLGSPSSAPPVFRNGELPKILRVRCPQVHFTFQTLTTTWGTSQTLDYLSYDIVIHLGLGVYDTHGKILVEDGAYNGRTGKDAAAQEAGCTIEIGCGQVLTHERMSSLVQSLHGRDIEGYHIEVPKARMGNNYICNETHWRALKALHAAEQDITAKRTLRACFFVHIPTPAKSSFKNAREQKAYEESFCDLADDTDYTELANGVAGVIESLIRESSFKL